MGLEFINEIYLFYLSTILLCNDAKVILEIFFGNDSIEIYKRDKNIELMIDYIHHIFKNVKDMKNKRKGSSILQEFINLSFENRKMFISNYSNFKKAMINLKM